MKSLIQAARQFTRFRVRTLLVLVSAVAVWTAWYAERVRNQQAAVVAIRKAGANIFYDFELAEDGPYVDYFHYYADEEEVSPVPKWLRRYVRDDYYATVAGLQFWAPIQANFDHSSVPELSRLPGLRKLIIYGSAFTDSNFQELENASSLTHLWLSDTSVTQEGISRFQRQHPKCKVEQ